MAEVWLEFSPLNLTGKYFQWYRIGIVITPTNFTMTFFALLASKLDLRISRRTFTFWFEVFDPVRFRGGVVRTFPSSKSSSSSSEVAGAVSPEVLGSFKILFPP